MNRLKILMNFTGALCLLGSALLAEEEGNPPFRVGREILKYERGDIQLRQKDWKDPGKGPIPAESWGEYDFEVPADGWYDLYFKDNPNLAREVFVDNARVSLSFGASPKSAAELLRTSLAALTQEGWSKEANLPLSAGKHTLRIERVGRMGFPSGMPRAWEIRAAEPGAGNRIAARIEGPRELRRGQSLKIAVTGGGGPAAEYEILQINELTQKSRSVAKIAFPESGKFLKKTVEIPAPEEGVFQLYAKAEGKLLAPREFIEGPWFAIDTQARPEVAGKDAEMKQVYDVDCVAGTINGAPVRLNENYWEANGPTRISTTAAGRYRESNDGRGPETNPHPKGEQENFSGFGYLFDIPETGKPYLIEIDHPDDDWRSVCISVVDVYDKEKGKGYLPPTFAYETGGNLPLSNRMLTEKVMFWPNGKTMHLGLASARIGKRAAAAHIRIYEVKGNLPAQTVSGKGRFAGLYMEEPERWHTHFNTPKNLSPEVRDYVGLTRTVEWAAYTGMNAFWPSVVAYQEATYDSSELKGYLLKYYNVPRLSALLCEKYNLGYVGEIFLARQRYFNQKTMTEGMKNPDELYTATWWGYSAAGDPSVSANLPRWNILHPKVQEKMIAIYGELADSLGDIPSFIGLSGRLDSWQWDGLYALTSLNWGYEDWTIAQFEKDTGIRVPGSQDDPGRFEKRYRFLVAEGMKAKWIAWREARVTDFLRRLAARIGKSKKDTLLFLCGNARTDEAHGPSMPESIAGRLEEMGIDLGALKSEPLIAILPTGNYGRGKTVTYLADEDSYDAFLDPAYIAAGFNQVRGFGEFGAYQEHGDLFPLAKLGMPLERWWYTSGSDAAGENSLERLSAVLAEQDTMVFRDGGYPMTLGRRDDYSQWMADFTRLPRLPFEPVAFARDPVAVWQRAGKSDFLFYLVNRERYPVKIALGLSGAGEVTRLGTGETVKVENGTLVLEMQPYQLRAFRAPKTASLRSANVTVPRERIEFVRQRLVFAQHAMDEAGGSVFGPSFSEKEKGDYAKNLDAAWEAFQKGAYWRARTLLSSAPMMAIYEKLGAYPPKQVETKFPNCLEPLKSDRFEPDEPFADAESLVRTVTPESGATLVDSETFNKEWTFTKVVRSGKEGVEFDLDVPVANRYRLSVGYVAETPGVMAVTLNGRSLPIPMVSTVAGSPEKVVFPETALPKGKVRLSIRRPDAFGIYAVKLTPVLRPLPTNLWSTVGPFRSFWGTSLREDESDAAVKAGMEKSYPPQENPALDAVYRNEGGRELRWQQTREIVGSHEPEGVNFSQRSGLTGIDFGFAQTFIDSPDEREAVLYIGTDWWANAYLNGELLKPDCDRKELERTGAWFNRWKPRLVKVTLKKGVNSLLVKQQGGTLNCWFTAYITDSGGLKISPVPEKGESARR